MKVNDAISGVLLLILSLAVLWNVSSYPTIPGQNVGPAAFPGLLAALLLVCSLILIVRGLRERGVQPWVVLGSWMTSPWHRRNFFVTLGCLLFYIFASNDLGFIPCAIIVLAAMFWALDVRPVLILPVAVGMTLLVHMIFYKGLRVPLPWGILLPWQW